MSMNAPMLQGQNGGLPRGELLGRYRSYEDAQKVVEHLASSEGFDVKNLSIVGNDLRTVEHIRTRLSYPRVALGGAAQGALFGAFIGLLIFTFSPDSTPLDIVMAVLMGMAIWMIIGVIGYSVRKGRRDFASSSQLVATTFDVVCDFGVAVHARRLVPGAGVVSLGLYDDPTSTPSSAPAAGPGAAPGAADQTPPGEDSAPHDAPRPAPDRASSQTGSGYDDLPDGRPRFGVRVDADRSSAPTGRAPAADAGNTEAGNTDASSTHAEDVDAESTDSRT
ncbi:DUF3021 domain-containing protein [Nesterenkonia marinintestina]|uniref:DUF3021 domain-containing protein n=1 Tax=Nesterenkonia marinintestina TaxID=2979865 RepID=UPI0021C19D7F|nr:DUF3021 domain-containing protein [Nesterenkonia sp. GX14115]